MKILNRPMFRYGGPIKEGIMSGIQEPRQKYNEAGRVFQEIAKSYAVPAGAPVGLRSNQVPRGDVLQGAAELGIASPYKTFDFKPYMKKVVTKPTNLNMSETDQLAAEVEQIDPVGVTGLTDLQKAKLGKTFIGTQEYRDKVKELEALEEAKNLKSNADGTVTTKGKSPFAYTVDEVIKNKGKGGDDDPPPPTRKEKVNSILEGLGYDRAQKNALYDAMIKAGQRISRTGLGAENLVSDVIAETSQSYDKPEKLREAANLMQVQQDLKLDQIKASKTGGTLKQNYDFYISQGDSKEVAEKKARSLPTTITEKFNASKANTDSGKVYNVTMELTEEGFFGDDKEYNGRIAKKYDKDGGLKEFLVSEDFKGDGVYNFKGEAILIEDGQVKKRTIIQPKVEKEGFFS
jgi:hypothetical protein